MPDLWLPGSHLGNWLAAAIIAWGLLLAHRWIARQSSMLGFVFAAGLLCRIFAGLFLFTVSYMDLPIAGSLHSGDGFWESAPDARTYYRTALRVHDEGASTLTTESSAGSPAYITTLALWMRIVGVSPAAGFFLNVVLLTILCVLVVRLWRPRNDMREDAPCAIVMAAFAVSPSILIHGSQSMKDDLFTFLVAAVCFSALHLMDRDARHRWIVDAAACVVIGVAVWLICGIRSYFGLMVWTCLLAGFLAALIRGGRREAGRLLLVAIASLGLSWYGYKIAAGTDYWNPVQIAMKDRPPAPPPVVAPAPPPPGTASPAPAGTPPGTAAPVIEAPSAASKPEEEPGLLSRINSLATERLRLARLGFETSGGATNVRVERRASGLRGELQVLAFGLATIFVPVSALKALGLIQFEGGRGLLLLTDVDTLFVDATILATLYFLFRRWPVVRPRLPYVIFIGGLAVLSAALLGYVVTNYGTLFRLRVLMAVPFWLLVLALARGHTSAPRDAA